MDALHAPVTDLLVAGITSAAYVTITNSVRSSASTITLGSKVADTAAHSTGQLVTIRPSEGWYAIDAPAGAALSTADYAELAITLADGTRLVYPTMHGIDSSVSGVAAATRTELATELARIDVAVSTRNAVTPPTVSQFNARTLPTADYFAPATDTVARVTLVDTVTTNTDMRGTDGANTTIPPTAASIASAVWAAGTRTLTAISDSAGVGTLLSRITGLLRTKAQDDAATSAVLDEIDARTLPSAEYMTGAAYTAPLDATQTQSAAVAALTAYDPPTRAEATSDKDEVLGAIADAIGSGLVPVIVLTPEQARCHTGSTITIVQGDDYTGLRKLPVEIDSEAELEGQYVVLAIKRNGEIGVSFRSQVYLGDDAKQYFDIDMPSDITSQMGAGDWQYIVRMELEIAKETRVASGIWRVIGFSTPVPVQGIER